MAHPERSPRRRVMSNKKLPFDANDFLSKVDGGRTVTKYRAQAIIYRQGDPADTVFFLQKGKAKVSVLSNLGKEAVVAFLNSGEFFGEACLGGQPLRLTTVATLTECLVTCIPKAEVISVIHEHPEFAELFIAHLLARNRRVEEDLVDQLFNSSEKRLARTLLLLANFGKDGAPEPVLPKISQETLADIVGTTRSRVSAFMNKFRRLGLISYNGHIEVHRSLLNVVLHEKPEIRT
jgi:CRP/FNR family cyclic AMP-dependent transcriptional regulator